MEKPGEGFSCQPVLSKHSSWTSMTKEHDEKVHSSDYGWR